MNIRPYSHRDWPSICEIHDSARIFELQAAGLTDAFLPLEKAAENEGLFDGHVFVAELNDRVCGFAAYSHGELTWLYVDPGSFRQGIGRRLVRHAIALAGGHLDTEVLVGNKGALDLYLSEGFKIVRRSDGRLAGHESFTASGYVLRFTASEN